jgi:class 3 adenylate cyclase
MTHTSWIDEGNQLNQQQQQQQQQLRYLFRNREIQETSSVTHNNGTFPTIFNLSASGTPETDNGPGPFAPLWQSSPTQGIETAVNFNLISNPRLGDALVYMMDSGMAVLSKLTVLSDSTTIGDTSSSGSRPTSFVFYPVFDSFDAGNRSVVGGLSVDFIWPQYFENVLPDDAHGLIVVVENACDDSFTYQISGSQAVFLGNGDLHDPTFDSWGVPFELASNGTTAFGYQLPELATDYCQVTIQVYPSAEMQSSHITSQPILIAFTVVLVFLVTLLVCAVYDCLVERRQKEILVTAARSNQIVSSLFPSNVRDRLLQSNEPVNLDSEPPPVTEGEPPAEPENPDREATAGETAKLQLKSFLSNVPASADQDMVDEVLNAKPIADLFPNTTVMFADIAGFTAWSSQREPSQVFTLLEAVYRSFDAIAKRRGVFKVETIGDCYVAVTGLPDPQPDHAVIMARFAHDCMLKMKDVTRRLEVTLGPDTGDLTMRFGLHSGPVTAGVLRGEKSRFQLFGDTVNTAARMESTGKKDFIHISQETAELLCVAGKSHWIKPRDERVFAKGKGEMNTFWLMPRSETNPNGKESVVTSSTASTSEKSVEAVEDLDIPEDVEVIETSSHGGRGIQDSHIWGDPTLEVQKATSRDKLERLVDWNVEILLRLLKMIVVRRNLANKRRAQRNVVEDIEAPESTEKSVLEEVTETITLPSFDPRAATHVNPDSVRVSSRVVEQLRDYVSAIASMYRDNPFHNFEHASHVAMSANKLLQRIVTPDDINYEKESSDGKKRKKEIAADLHNHTFGIASDPLTQFAVVFSALIHDVDHMGVPNFVLIIENEPVAARYKNKSVAEQNSVDLSWNLLMDPRYNDLRRCIYTTDEEAKRFRQLVVNSVIATDIFDKELSEQRRNRWKKAFHVTPRTAPLSMIEDANRKATIVIEHIIQASDVAHCMQHWHVYEKWNKKLFREMYAMYRAGRTSKDPAEGWYQGEISFFDNYVLPLANKLKECGVFGVSGDEYLNYALENRREWATKGRDIVASIVAEAGGLPPSAQ